MLYRFIFFFLIFMSAMARAEDDCLDWFKASGVSYKGKGCPIKCNLVETDMNTFICPKRCPEFCIPAPKCKPDPYWVGKIKVGLPKDWPNSSELSGSWSKEEREAVLTALGQLPEELKNKNLKGIFRLNKSIQIINPGTQIDYSIAIYDRAFNGPFSLGRVLAHELAHVWFDAASPAIKNSYRKASGWTLDRPNRTLVLSKDRRVVDQGAKDSPEEDFAHNLDSYLFEPERLKAVVPDVAVWFRSHFSIKFILKTECQK
jgi:hypothetical protein